MGIDIRVPLGAMFTLLGAMLAGFGLWGDQSIYAKTLGINANLDWGVVLLVFGVLMLFLGLRPKPQTPATGDEEPRRAGH